MTKFTKHKFIRFGVSFFALFSIIFLVSSLAIADCQRGTLDVRFCDEDGDLVADTPTDPKKWLDPDTLIFSYNRLKTHLYMKMFLRNSWIIWPKTPVKRCAGTVRNPTLPRWKPCARDVCMWLVYPPAPHVTV